MTMFSCQIGKVDKLTYLAELSIKKIELPQNTDCLKCKIMHSLVYKK